MCLFNLAIFVLILLIKLSRLTDISKMMFLRFPVSRFTTRNILKEQDFGFPRDIGRVFMALELRPLEQKYFPDNYYSSSCQVRQGSCS